MKKVFLSAIMMIAFVGTSYSLGIAGMLRKYSPCFSAAMGVQHTMSELGYAPDSPESMYVASAAFNNCVTDIDG